MLRWCIVYFLLSTALCFELTVENSVSTSVEKLGAVESELIALVGIERAACYSSTLGKNRAIRTSSCSP